MFEVIERDLSGVDGKDKSLWLWCDALGWVAEFHCQFAMAQHVANGANVWTEEIKKTMGPEQEDLVMKRLTEISSALERLTDKVNV